jgi:hypothetical protein
MCTQTRVRNKEDDNGGAFLRHDCDSSRNRHPSSQSSWHVIALIWKSTAAFLLIVAVVSVKYVHKFLQVHHNEYMAEPRTSRKNTRSNKILMYITTHLSDGHYASLEHCWPSLIAKSPLFKLSDFMIFATEPPGTNVNMTLIDSVFAGAGVVVHGMENPGYNEGAILALTEAMDSHWFDKYEWVIRVNPDVLIRNDSFLLERFEDSRIHGIFADCLDVACRNGNKCVNRLIHSDFFAVRPSAVSPSAVRDARRDNAERMITEAFSSIVTEGADDWVPGAGPHRSQCRISGELSPVIHTNDFDTLYPACLSYYD